MAFDLNLDILFNGKIFPFDPYVWQLGESTTIPYQTHRENGDTLGMVP